MGEIKWQGFGQIVVILVIIGGMIGGFINPLYAISLFLFAICLMVFRLAYEK